MINHDVFIQLSVMITTEWITPLGQRSLDNCLSTVVPPVSIVCVCVFFIRFGLVLFFLAALCCFPSACAGFEIPGSRFTCRARIRFNRSVKHYVVGGNGFRMSWYQMSSVSWRADGTDNAPVCVCVCVCACVCCVYECVCVGE